MSRKLQQWAALQLYSLACYSRLYIHEVLISRRDGKALRFVFSFLSHKSTFLLSQTILAACSRRLYSCFFQGTDQIRLLIACVALPYRYP